jgi:putative heme-binding domain-containing protein
VAALLKGDDEGVRAETARAAGQWGIESVRPPLTEWALDPKTPAPLRQAAVDGLAALGGPASRGVFDELAAGKGPAEVRRMGLIALTGLNLEQAAARAPAVLAASDDGGGAADVFDAFLQRKDGAALLAKSLDGQKLPTDVAKVGVRAVRTSGRDAPGLVEALTKAGGLTFGARTLTPDELTRMVADVQKEGDASRGEAVFRRKDMLCMRCHAVAGCGGQVGPDLSSVGASAQVDYLIESILLPSKAIKENYHAVIVNTTQGLTYTGIKVQENADKLVLRTKDDTEVVIPIKDIDEKQNSKVSLMPDGLTDTLTRGELLDLVRFLSELGKVGPYSVSKARLVRRWQALEATPEARHLLQRNGAAAAAGDDPALLWSPAYSTVAGILPPAEVPRLDLGKDADPAAVVRCQLDVTTPGAALLRLNGAKGVRLWLDRKPVDAKEATELNLSAGVHTLTFALDLAERKDALRCELDDAPGSPARVRVVGGK